MQTRSRVVALLLFDEVELLDVAGPLSVLSHAGRHWNWRPFKVYCVAERVGSHTTRSQLEIVSQHALGTCPPPEIVIVPGGYGARRALSSEPVQSWLTTVGEGAVTLAAIGNGALLLGKAGLLGGARVAVREELRSELSALEPSVELQPLPQAGADVVVESGKVLVASGSGTSLELGLRIVARALGPKLASGTAQGLGIPWLAPEQTIDVVRGDP